MENKRKQFKPFDKVLIREQNRWFCDLYSHYNNERKVHVTLATHYTADNNILPYEGNEHLVGTTDEAEIEEVELEEGELVVYFGEIEDFEKQDLYLARFDEVTENQIIVKTEFSKKWKYAIRFSDFNPDDMEETKKHILCVRNWEIIRYKDEKSMSINLNKLDSMLDNALEKETTESLNEWIKTKEPLFTFTAEEVDIIKYHFTHKQKALDSLLHEMEFDDERDTDEYIRWKCQYKEISNILNRIKEWENC